MSEQASKFPTIAGAALAATGLAHFVRPQLFEGITKPAFPNDTDRYLKINGSIETAIGVGLLVPQTRKLAVAGALGYVAYLGVNAVRNR